MSFCLVFFFCRCNKRMKKEDALKMLYSPKAYAKGVRYIKSIMNGDSKENFNDGGDVAVAGSILILAILIILIVPALYIWALVITIKYWNEMETWAKVLALIGILTPFGGPLMTIIVVYLSKNRKITNETNKGTNKKSVK